MNPSLFLSSELGRSPSLTDQAAELDLVLTMARQRREIEMQLLHRRLWLRFSKVQTLPQGGLERSQRQAHILVDVVSTPIPATNPNGTPEVYRSVHVFPKGRW